MKIRHGYKFDLFSGIFDAVFFYSCPFLSGIYLQQQEHFGLFVRSLVTRVMDKSLTTMDYPNVLPVMGYPKMDYP